MERLIAETKEKQVQTQMDFETAEQTQEKVLPVQKLEAEKEFEKNLQSQTEQEVFAPSTEYINSLENVTVGEMKHQNADPNEKQLTIAESLQKKQINLSENVIEKPNYDFIEENKKIVKITKKERKEKLQKNKSKIAGKVMACVLGAATITCIANGFVLDSLGNSLSEISEVYNLNLVSYLDKINDLDVAHKSMDIIETYPDDLLAAGDFGEKSNWFDIFSDFIRGVFGG